MNFNNNKKFCVSDPTRICYWASQGCFSLSAIRWDKVKLPEEAASNCWGCWHGWKPGSGIGAFISYIEILRSGRGEVKNIVGKYPSVFWAFIHEMVVRHLLPEIGLNQYLNVEIDINVRTRRLSEINSLILC